jgi:hypothetical protein
VNLANNGAVQAILYIGSWVNFSYFTRVLSGVPEILYGRSAVERL